MNFLRGTPAEMKSRLTRLDRIQQEKVLTNPTRGGTLVAPSGRLTPGPSARTYCKDAREQVFLVVGHLSHLDDTGTRVTYECMGTLNSNLTRMLLGRRRVISCTQNWDAEDEFTLYDTDRTTVLIKETDPMNLPALHHDLRDIFWRQSDVTDIFLGSITDYEGRLRILGPYKVVVDPETKAEISTYRGPLNGHSNGYEFFECKPFSCETTSEILDWADVDEQFEDLLDGTIDANTAVHIRKESERTVLEALARMANGGPMDGKNLPRHELMNAPGDSSDFYRLTDTLWKDGGLDDVPNYPQLDNQMQRNAIETISYGQIGGSPVPVPAVPMARSKPSTRNGRIDAYYVLPKKPNRASTALYFYYSDIPDEGLRDYVDDMVSVAQLSMAKLARPDDEHKPHIVDIYPMYPFMTDPGTCFCFTAWNRARPALVFSPDERLSVCLVIALCHGLIH